MRQGHRWGKGCALLACATLGACTLFSPHPMRATAMLRPTAGNATHGTVALAERREGIQVNYDVVGLTPNTPHTFIIHVGGDCRGPDASDAGPRFRPIDVVPRRDDDQLTRIWADANGAAVGFFVLPGLSLDGVRSVVGRTMIIDSGADDGDDDLTETSPPPASTVSGASAATLSAFAADQARDDDAGKPLACGVIAR